VTEPKKPRENWIQNSRNNLTWEDVRYIRATDESVTVLAKRYGVTRSTIYNVLHGKSWKPETDPEYKAPSTDE
jgi:hypothetical protein